jgi:glycosyltransferase involved in cell wall biosynthesis
MTTPKISLVTPSYNQGRYVARTVRSVLLQDYPNLEYIFLDGGSSDSTMSEVAPYLDRFAYWRSAPDGGQAAAVHDGLARASGEIMGYLNSDDLLAPGALRRVAHYFARHPDVDAVYSHRLFVDGNDVITRTWLLPPHSSYLISRWDFLPQETCFWRRSLFERAGNVDPGLAFALDYDLFVRYMRAGRFARLNAFLGAFRWHDASKSAAQLDTVGAREIAAVQARHGIRFRPHDFFVGKAFVYLMPRVGSAYARLPGMALAPFLGSRGRSFNDVWQGRLLADART